nr:MAG TPA: hypothetical protein [Herelleviridae sp.]
MVSSIVVLYGIIYNNIMLLLIAHSTYIECAILL